MLPFGARSLSPVVTVAILSLGTMVYTFWPYIKEHPHGKKVLAYRDKFVQYRKELEQGALEEHAKMLEVKTKIHGKDVKDIAKILDEVQNETKKQ